MLLVEICSMTFLGAMASVFLKRASGAKNVVAAIKNPNLYLGGILYLIAAIINIYVLKVMDYSVVLPLTSITYIWTMIISYTILKEKITYKKMLGVAFITLGAFLIAVNG